MRHSQPPTNAAPRPVFWLGAALAWAFALLMLYVPFAFQADLYRYMYPFVRPFGATFGTAGMLLILSLTNVGLPPWVYRAGQALLVLALSGWVLMQTAIAGISTGQISFVMVIVAVLFAAFVPRWDAAVFRYLYAALLVWLGGIVLVGRIVSPTSVYGQVPHWVEWLFILPGLGACLGPLLAARWRHAPWLSMLLPILPLGWYDFVLLQDGSWLGIGILGTLTAAAVVFALYLRRPWHLQMPGLRRRIVALVLTFAIIPTLALGAFLVYHVQTLGREQSLTALRVAVLNLDQDLRPTLLTQSGPQPDLAALRQQLQETTLPSGLQSAIVSLTDIPASWPMQAGIAALEDPGPGGNHQLVAFIRHPAAGVAVLVTQPAAAAYAQAWHSAGLILLGTLLLAVLALLLSLHLGNRVTRRLIGIQEALVAIGQQQYALGTLLDGPPPDDDELGRVATTLLEMAVIVETQRAELQTQNEELNAQAQELLHHTHQLTTQNDQLLQQGAELAARGRQQQVVAEFGQYALTEANVDNLLRRAVDLVAQTLGVDLTHLLALGPDGHSLSVRVAQGWGATHTLAQPVAMDHLLPTPTDEFLRAHGFASGAAVLIQGPARPFGLLGTYATRPRTFTEDEGQFLQAMANVVAERLALATAEQTVQAESAQRELERTRLQTVLDVLPVGVALAGPTGALLQSNAAFQQIWGAAPPPVSQVADYVQFRARPAGRDEWLTPDESGVTRALRQGTSSVDEELQIATFDGQTKTILYSAVPITDPAGEIAGAVAVQVDITERKRAEDSLQQSEALLAYQKRILELIVTGAPLNDVLETIVQGIEEQASECFCVIRLVAPTGPHLRRIANASLPPTLVQTLDSIVAQASPAPFGTALAQSEPVIIPDFAQETRWEAARDLALAHGVRGCRSAPIRSLDGDVLGTITSYHREPLGPNPAEEALAQISTHLAGIAIERKRAEESSHLKLQSLIRNVAEGVVAVDENRRILVVNPAARDLLGLPSPAEGGALEEVGLPAPLRDLLWRATGPGFAFERQVLRSGQAQVEAKVYAVGTDEERYGVIALLQDVTEELKFRHLQESFVASFSHEFRGPLASLGAVIQAMYDDLIPREQRKRFEQAALDESERLRRLTDALLDMARLDAGVVALAHTSFDLGALGHMMADKLAARCAAAGLALQVDCPPLTIHSDRDRIEQVLMNLLENAIRYTPRGGRIHLSLQPQGERVVMQVGDTGVGIPQEHLAYIWERFYKVDQARTHTSTSGAGLGLSIVRELVRRLGGDVSVESMVGQGSVFSVELPLG